MSAPGSPGGRAIYSKPTPPERGSFPLDHDGECKAPMSLYLACIKASRGKNTDECRALSKAYLKCRMERNLMARDSMANLGFAGLEKGDGAEQRRADGEGKGDEAGSEK